MTHHRRQLYELIGEEDAARIESVRGRRGGRLLQQRPRRVRLGACRDVVERLTDLLDGVLTSREQEEVDRHLEGCEGCTRALAQWQQVVALLGRLADDDVGATDRDELLAAYQTGSPGAPD
jgi:hypothetical protein